MKDGGSAFPFPVRIENCEIAEDALPELLKLSSGMSLRDYFAAAALTGMIANTSGRTISARVKHAWEYADAMLAEREKP